MVPLVGDTLLGVKKNSVEQQSYQRISAETVGVGANNQGEQDGKPVYDGGGAYDVVSQPPGVQIPTTKYDWGVTRSLSGEERPAVRQQLTPKVVFLWRSSTRRIQ